MLRACAQYVHNLFTLSLLSGARLYTILVRWGALLNTQVGQPPVVRNIVRFLSTSFHTPQTINSSLLISTYPSFPQGLLLLNQKI